MLFLWVTSAFPSISTSSAMLCTFLMPLTTLSTLFWKTSPTTKSANGSHNHLNLSHGVVNIVIRFSLSSMTCQYIDITYSRVKSVKTSRSGRMSSIFLLYHCFCLMLLLRSFGSKCNLRKQSYFFTGTIELTHSLYTLTSVIKSSFSSLSSSAL